MSRPIWKGHILFGLVNVPVVVYSAEKRSDLNFHLIDSRNAARVRYERVNEATGEEVPWDKIVKGFEYDGGDYVLLSEQEMEHASVKMTRTIEIEQFVDIDEIDIRYFDRPYLLAPDKNGEKGYVLLREALTQSGKAGIADVVIRTRQYLAALIAKEDALLLELLRYEQELRKPNEFDLPGHDLRKIKVSRKELDLAKQLINGLSAKWNPRKHHDKYRDVLMQLIKKKVKSGQTEAIETVEEEAVAEEPKTINFMDVLKKSLAKTTSRGGAKGSAKSKSSTRKSRSTQKRRKRAG